MLDVHRHKFPKNNNGNQAATQEQATATATATIAYTAGQSSQIFVKALGRNVAGWCGSAYTRKKTIFLVTCEVFGATVWPSW